MKEYWSILRKASLFAGIDDEELDSILLCLSAKKEHYTKGQYTLRAGDRAEAVGLVLAGGILVFQEDFWGNRNLMARIAPGQLFAEAFACSPGSVLNVSAVAEEDSVILWLNVQQILTTCPTACSHHSRMIRNLLSELAGKNLRFHEKLTHMSQRTTAEKLLSYLSAEAQRQGAREFDIPFSRQQLADYLAVERSAMSAALGKLRDEGLLEFNKNHFILNGEASKSHIG